MKRIIICFASLACLFAFSKCSDIEKDIPVAVNEGIHGAGAMDTVSSQFHSNMLTKYNWSLPACQSCHAKDYSGGPSKINCSQCHAGIKVHTDETVVMNKTNQGFHGAYFKNTGAKTGICADCHGSQFTGGKVSPACKNCHASVNIHAANYATASGTYLHGAYFKNSGNLMSVCGDCHGADYAGGISSPSCNKCHSTLPVHKTNLMDQTSNNFHGNYFKTAGIKMSECQQCHGNGFAGGQSSPACQNCHSTIAVHKDGISDPSSANFHGNAIKTSNWNMQPCKTCHGSSYAGGVSSPSCKTCHTQPAGPEACNTCHGSKTDPTNIAPPRDTKHNTTTVSAGVGAHQTHLYNAQFSASLSCSECHKVPQTPYTQGHMNGTTDIAFGSLSSTNVAALPSYNFGTNKCSNTYCHGGFVFKKSNAGAAHDYIYTEDQITGNNFMPQWNKVDGSQAACGTCHGLPPKGHIQLDIKFCVNCHGSVINEAGQIIDKSKHINGKIDMN